MRILHLVTRRQRRGAEVFASDLADALVRRGHEATVVGLYPADGEMLVPEAAKWIDLSAPAEPRLRLRTIASLVRLIREFDPDVVQANGSDTLKYSALAKYFSRGRWRLVYRNISVASHWLRSPLHQGWARWLVGLVDHVVSVSEASGVDFLQTFRLDARRMTMIPRAVRLPAAAASGSLRHRLCEQAGIPTDLPVLVHVGNFSPEKNHEWLLESFARIRTEVPEAHLVLIGDGVLHPQISRIVALNGHAGSVHLLGMRRDASDLVGGGDVFVLPSLIEGIPGVVLEAGAHGVPSVATDVGGVRQAVKDGMTGFVCAPGDQTAFVAAVVRLLKDAELRRRMGVAARELVEREFHLDAIVSRYECLYALLHRRTSLVERRETAGVSGRDG